MVVAAVANVARERILLKVLASRWYIYIYVLVDSCVLMEHHPTVIGLDRCFKL